MTRKFLHIFASVLLAGCTTATWNLPDDFIYKPVSSGDYEIATWQRITDSYTPIHIYIEGDGHSFDARGVPTHNPTPRGKLVREMATHDTSANVIYMSRPCQYIMSAACKTSDWTDGRFSKHIIDSVAGAIKSVAGDRPVILIGYSGGAMISGLIISEYPDLDVREWITVAGVLNHADWTSYFGDTPLTSSMNMNVLPRVKQRHYLAPGDKVVPNELSLRIANPDDIIFIPGATHGNFGEWTPTF